MSGGLQLLAHDVTGPLVPNTRAKYCPAQARIPRLLVEGEQIKRLYPSPPSLFLDSRTECSANAAATKIRADKYSAQPRSQVFAPLKIMHAKCGSSEKLSIRVRNPCNRQLVSIHVRL